MTRDNIKTKDGRVSAYGFACGYIDGKDYFMKMRGGVPYLWTVYVDKVATALEKIRG